MPFRLTHPNNVRLFPTREGAEEACPLDAGRLTYKALYSKKADSWIVAEYQNGNLNGYLEKENA